MTKLQFLIIAILVLVLFSLIILIIFDKGSEVVVTAKPNKWIEDPIQGKRWRFVSIGHAVVIIPNTEEAIPTEKR